MATREVRGAMEAAPRVGRLAAASPAEEAIPAAAVTAGASEATAAAATAAATAAAATAAPV